MALLKVRWSETCTYETEIEVDGYDPDEDPSDEESGVMEQILNLEGAEFDKAFMSVDEREVGGVVVIREGDLTPDVVPAAPSHEAMF